jgi:hypothetical protein
MSKLTITDEVEFDDVYETEISDEDYGFVLGPDGELKAVFLPEDLPFSPPEKIAKILELFGISDLEQVEQATTLH